MAKKKDAPVEPVAPSEMTVENRELSIDLLHVHSRNYNRHGPEQVRKLVRSLERFRQVRSIVVWRNPADGLLYILAGHGITEAAKSLGWKTIRADVLDFCDEITALSYLVADNEHARDSDPDKAALALIIDEVSQYDSELLEAMSFDEGKFAALLAEVEAGIDSAGSSTGMDGGYGAGGGGGGYGGGESGGSSSGSTSSKASPDEFPEYGENIETQYCCPKCSYRWSGKPS